MADVDQRGSTMQNRATTLIATVSLIVLLFPGAVAEADDGAADPPAAVERAMEQAAQGRQAPGEVVAEVSGVTTTIPLDAAAPIVVDTPEGDRLTVSLPATAHDSRAVMDGTRASVQHDLTDGTALVPIARRDGVLQILAVLDTADDPTRYEFDFGSEQGIGVVLRDDGSASLQSKVGTEIATIAAPWALDAGGHPVPTHFEADGTRLVQVLEPSRETRYPVVADPAIRVSRFEYRYVNIVKVPNWTNTSKQVGICKVAGGAGGGTCTIANSYTVGTHIDASFGLSTASVAAGIGIAEDKTVTSTVQWTSPAAAVGSSFKAWAVGTKVTYQIQKWKVSKAGGRTSQTLLSTSRTLTAFSPVVGFAVGQ